MRRITSIFTLVLLYATITFGQAAIEIPFDVADDVGNSKALVFGLDLTATGGIDPGLGEVEQPPLPPTGVFDTRFVSNAQSTLGQGTLVDIRNAPAFPFSGSYIHQIYYQTGDLGTAVTISWNLPPEIIAGSEIRDLFGGVFYAAPFVGTGSITITNPAVVTGLEIEIVYDNIAPAGPAPEFVISPASLDFGPIGVGLTATLQATVSNPGTDPLEISNITSSDPQFTFAPNAFPISVAPGGNVIFDVTFAPTALGTFPADITFTHNAPTNPDVLPVVGVGADAGPTFSVDPTSLNFGTVILPNSHTLSLTVTNNGFLNPMNVSSVTSSLPEYTVSPATATIAPGGNQVFDVTFTPSAAATFAGDITFNHDGTTSPDVVPVTGDGYVPAAVNGLVFEKDTVWNLEEDFYTETMQLLDVPPGPNVQALQFRLYTNQQVDDNTILTFQSIQKGTDVSDASWILDYNVFRGPITGNGASQDEIYVVLYNLNQNGGLPAGANYTDLLNVTYRVADLPALQDSVKSSFLIANAEASTFEGFPIDITPSRDELVILAKNRVGSLGDVNGDGCIDILDLIMVVDHIVGRDSLDADEFARADIAPWTPGNALPDPDGFVNVQDLALIQNIILTATYPDGTPINSCGPSGLPKFNGEADAIVNLYINKEGITAYLDSKVGIRGAQIEFGNMIDDPGNMVINTELGDGYYLKLEEMLRTLMYDRLAEKYVEAGSYEFMADMPFTITNPEDISLDKLILVDINQRKVMKLEVNLIYSTPTLPYDYILFQNYPNPFNPNTAVRFQVPKTSNVTVKIYDMLGQEVRTLFAGEVTRGTYTVNWDGLNNAGVKMSSGSYIYRMIAGEFVQSKKMILLK